MITTELFAIIATLALLAIVATFLYKVFDVRDAKGFFDDKPNDDEHKTLLKQKQEALKFIVSQIVATMSEGGETIISMDKCNLGRTLQRHTMHARNFHRKKVSALSSTEIYLLRRSPWIVFKNAGARGLYVQLYEQYAQFLHHKIINS